MLVDRSAKAIRITPIIPAILAAIITAIILLNIVGAIADYFGLTSNTPNTALLGTLVLGGSSIVYRKLSRRK